MLVSDSDGNVLARRIAESNFGRLSELTRLHLESIMVHRTQWFPNDNGLFCVTQPSCLTLVDAASFAPVEKYRFDGEHSRHGAVYWSDWNGENLNLLAVGLSNSSVRFVDVRTGSSVQQLTVASPGQSVQHHITRLVWVPHDEDCLLVGDSAGYLHVFDVRRPRKALQTVGEEELGCTQQISCMQYTEDRMQLLVGQGYQGRPSLYEFRGKRLRNANVNFTGGQRFSTRSLMMQQAKSAFLKCQMHCSGGMLFRPVADGYGEVKVQSLRCGRTVNTFLSPDWQPTSVYNSTCVTGLWGDHPVVYSGSRSTVRVWAPLAKSDQLEQVLREAHADNWSDSE